MSGHCLRFNIFLQIVIDMETVPDGSVLVDVVFQEGPLGVILRRRNSDGVVYVHEVI